jgi:hypothetical protein
VSRILYGMLFVAACRCMFIEYLQTIWYCLLFDKAPGMLMFTSVIITIIIIIIIIIIILL